MTWRTISATETDADSPITQQLMDALRLNPVAIAEQDSGAPKIMDRVVSGSATAGSVTFTSLDAYSGMFIHGMGDNATGGNETITIEFSDDGTTFYGSEDVCAVAAGESKNFFAFVDFATGYYRSVFDPKTLGAGYQSATVVGISNAVVSIRLNFNSELAVIAIPQGGRA